MGIETWVVMLLTGTYQRTLDDKLRLAIPKSLREAIDPRDSTPLFLAPGTDGSVVCYPEPAFRELAAKLTSRSPNARAVRDYARLFFARASACQLDAQGRVRIPTELATLAELAGEVVLLGVQDHLEIWSKPRWETYSAERAASYDDLAESAFDTPM